MLKKDLSSPPVPWARNAPKAPPSHARHMRIAWTHGDAIYMADIVYDERRAKLRQARRSSTATDLPFHCGLETQSFRPPKENELTFSAYGYQGTEVMG